MKKFTHLLIAILMFIYSLAYAGETNFDSVKATPTGDDTYGISIDYPSGTTVWSVTKAGVVSGSFTRSIPLPLMSFIARSSSTQGVVLSSTSSPLLAIASEVPYAQWANAETPPLVRTIRIPDNYSSGGSFKLMATQTATGCYVDFDVYVNKSGSTLDSAATNQTPVLVSSTYTTDTPSLVTLTPATDFSSLTAGDWITVRIWRDSAATGTGSLRIHNVDFVYTANQ